MAEAQERRKRKRGRKAEASVSGNDHNVAQKAGKPKTKSLSSEEEVPTALPVRERKAVDRFVPGPQPNEKVREWNAFSTKQGFTEASSGFQGPGTKLRDIPNVVSNLSKKNSGEKLQVLHTILFGRKLKVYSMKNNILQFSGFLWAENEEKERAKVKERINKCRKDRLLLLCELLDIPGMKARTKKEEVSAKLLEFLESPHVTRSVGLAENRDRKQKSIKGSSQKAHGKGKVRWKPPPEPTEEEMCTVINDWANEIELGSKLNTWMQNMVSQLFRRLEAHFEMDLRHRKEEVRHIFASLCFEKVNQGGDAASSGEEDTGKKDAEGSGEDSGEEEEEEEDAEGSAEDDDAGEEEDATGSGDDDDGEEEEEDAEGSGEDDDDAGEEEDATGSGDDDAGEEKEEDATGSGDDDDGEEEEEEDAGRPGEDDAGEEEKEEGDAEGSDEDSGE